MRGAECVLGVVVGVAACGSDPTGGDGGGTGGASSTTVSDGTSSDTTASGSTGAASTGGDASTTDALDSTAGTTDASTGDSTAASTGSTGESGESSSGGSTGEPSVCGDGIVEGLEVCDGQDACLDDCTYPPNTIFWEHIEEGVAAGDDARVWGVDFDSADRPVYGGRRYGMGGSVFATVRDPDDTGVWTQLYPPSFGVGFAFGLAVAGDDRVVMPGQLNTLSPGNANDAYAATFLANGTPDWEWQLASPGNGLRVAAAALSDDTIALVGLDNGQPDDGEDLAQLSRVTAAGVEVWTVDHTGQAGVANDFVDVVTLDDDTIVVLGCCTDAASNLIAAYDPDGNQQWLTALSTPDSLSFFGGGIAVDPEGNVVVALPSGNDTLWLGAYDPDGDLVWGGEVDGTTGVYPNAVAATPQGGYVVAGSVVDGAAGDLWYGLVDDQLALSWSDAVEAPGTGTFARANDIEVDSHGLALVGGEFTTSASVPQELRGFVRYFAP